MSTKVVSSYKLDLEVRKKIKILATEMNITAGELIEKALERTIEQKRVTYDLHRLMEGATKLKTSEYASAIVENMKS